MEFIPYGKQTIEDDDIEAVVSVMKENKFLTTGPKIEEFENVVKTYYKKKFAVAVANGTCALHCATYACDFKPDDEVIVTTMSFVASSNCVLYVGAKPVFCDIDPETMNIDPNKIEKLITPKTKALIVVDFGGQCCDYDKIMPIVKKYNLILIEDACHALGTSQAGKYSDLTVFSFHPVKHITTGEGGMIITNKEEYYKRMKIFRTHGITRDYKEREKMASHYYEMIDLGYNFRITDIQCALGINQMKKLDRFVTRRKEIATTYDEQFKELEKLITPLTNKNENSYHLYIIKLNLSLLDCDRDVIFKELYSNKIGVNVHYIPIHMHPYYRKLMDVSLPEAEKVYKQILSLPMFPTLKKDELEYVIQTVKRVVLSHYNPLLTIREVNKCDSDAQLIMRWRNDETTRKMSFNSEVKIWDDFRSSFYGTYFLCKVKPIFVCIDNEPIAFIGFVKYDDDNSYSIGLNIAPDFRGLKLSSKILKLVINYVHEENKDIKYIYAEIKKINERSLKAVAKAGFTYLDEIVSHGVEVVRYIHNLRP